MDRETKRFWRERRREMLRRDRRLNGGWAQGNPITVALVLLMIAGWLAETFLPNLLGQIIFLPGGRWISALLSVILPGGILGLLFSGLFVWIIGTAIEGIAKPFQYLIIFFGSGFVGALVIGIMGGGGAALAAFGLAGGYVHSMAHISKGGAVQWALVLLGINAVLSGFQVTLLAGEASAFVAGLAIASLVRLGAR